MCHGLAKETKSKRFQGVYFRELDNGDRTYFLRLRLDGKVKRISIGKKSEGITEQFCNQEKNRILNAHRFGGDAAAQLQKVRRDDPAFEDLLNEYLEKRDLKPTTIDQLQILRKVPFYKSKKITRQDVQSYIDDLAKVHRASTVGLRFKQVRAVVRYAIHREMYKHFDPTVGIDLPKGTGPRKRYLTPEEIQKLLAAVVDKPRLYLFVKMSLCTGARMSTLMSVHSDHIQSDGTVNLYNHKAGRWYQGFFDDETMWLLKYKKGYVLAAPGKEDKEPAKQTIQYELLAIMDELFNEPNTPIEKRAVIHSLRHSVATQLITKGVPLEVVSKTLDHSSISITGNVYAKVVPDLIKNATKGLWD